MKMYVVKKLKSKKGSALLMALLFSIMCLLLGMAILAAGVTSNGRIINAAKTEQGYFIVASVYNEIDCLTRTQDVSKSNDPYGNLAFSFDVDLAGSTDDKKRETAIRPLDGGNVNLSLTLGPLQPYFTSAIKDVIVNHKSQVRQLQFVFGEELGENYVYEVTLEMTVAANDFSVYFDVTDIRKVTGDKSESIGVPSLHQIVVEAKSVTPLTAVRLEDGTEQWKFVNFEYHRAKLV